MRREVRRSSPILPFSRSFIAVRTLNIRSTLLANFKCTQYSIVNYRYDIGQQISRTFSSCLTATLYPANSNSPLPPPQPLATTILFFASMSLAISDTSYKWDHQYLSFYDWLMSLSVMPCRFTHVIIYDRIYFIFKAE